MFTILLYIGSAIFLAFSFFQDRKKTKLALKKALNAFLNILPDFAAVLALVAVLLTFVSPEIITRLLGEQAGAAGLFLASVVGSITLIPGFVAFPLAATLLQRGAGLVTIAVFISTLMMVGVVTFPLEKKFFGLKEALWRNSLSYVWAFFVGLAIAVVLTW